MDVQTARDALVAFNQDELPGWALRYALIRWDGWHVPLDAPEGELLVRENKAGERWAAAFSDQAALMQVEELKGSPFAGSRVIGGEELFAALPEGLTGLDLDPGTEHAINYRDEQLHQLVEEAGCARASQILVSQRIGDEQLQHLRNHEGFWFLTFVRREGKEINEDLVMAPDSQKRKLAALFTCEGALRAFLMANPTSLAGKELNEHKVSGRALGLLLQQLPLDGMVFDCCGPSQPTAYAADFAKELQPPLEAMAGEEE